MDETTKINGFKSVTTSFKVIISLMIALTGVLASAGTFLYNAGSEKEKIINAVDVLNKAVAGLKAGETLDRAKFDELVRRVYSTDKNVYGISVHLGIKDAIKTEESQL